MVSQWLVVGVELKGSVHVTRGSHLAIGVRLGMWEFR